MGNRIQKLLERVLSLQQEIQMLSLQLFAYSIFRFKYLFIPTFLSTLVDLSISLYIALHSELKTLYILSIIVAILLFINLVMIYVIFDLIYFHRIYDLECAILFVFNYIYAIPFFIFKLLILFLCIPPSNFEYMSVIHIQIIWGLISLPYIFKMGVIPSCLNLLMTIFTGLCFLILFPGFLTERPLDFYRMRLDEFYPIFDQIIQKDNLNTTEITLLSVYLERKCRYQLNEIKFRFCMENGEYDNSNRGIICEVCRSYLNFQCQHNIRLDCEHIFHIGCLKIWLETNIERLECPICKYPINLSDERLIDINTRPILKAHYTLAMYALIAYKKYKICFYHSRYFKHIPIIINLPIILIILVIITAIINEQTIWVYSSMLCILILFQQLMIKDLNYTFPVRNITLDIYTTDIWRDAQKRNGSLILDLSFFMFTNMFIYSISVSVMYICIYEEDTNSTLGMIILLIIGSKLIFDVVVEGVLVAICISSVMMIYDLFVVLPAIVYYVCWKGINIKQVILMY